MNYYKNDYEVFIQDSNESAKFMSKCLFDIKGEKLNGSMFFTNNYIYLIREKSNDKYKIPVNNLIHVEMKSTYLKNVIIIHCINDYQRNIYLNNNKELNKLYKILYNKINDNLKNNEEVDLYEYNDFKVSINRELVIADVIVLWWYSVVKNTETAPAYFHDRYEINFCERRDLLIEKGYLNKPDPITYLNQLKINDLKKILRNKKMKVSGNKKELILRIQQELTFEQLYELPNNRTLIPTEDGYQTLKKYSYIVYGHLHFDGFVTPISMWEKYCEMHAISKTKYPPEDVSWAIYNEIENEEQKKILSNETKQLGKLRNINLKKYQQLKRENINIEAIKILLVVLIIDFCKSDDKMITPNLYKELVILLEKEKINIDKLAELIDEAIRYVSHYIVIINIYEFYELVTALIENDKVTLEKYDVSL